MTAPVKMRTAVPAGGGAARDGKGGSRLRIVLLEGEGVAVDRCVGVGRDRAHRLRRLGQDSSGGSLERNGLDRGDRLDAAAQKGDGLIVRQPLMTVQKAVVD